MSQFSELNAFVCVVDRGSFSAAAEQLGIVKSAVSKKVSELELRLGVKLLNRTTRRLNLTDSGQLFYDRAKQILHDLTEAESLVLSESTALRGTLKVAAPLSFGISHLASAINDFMLENDGIKIDVDLNDRQVNVIEEGFDLAIRIGHLKDSTLMARKLAPIKLLLCASPEYIHIWGEPKTPQDLQGHQALNYGNIGKNWRFIDSHGKACNVQVPVRMRANNGEILLDAAIAGLGVVLTPSFIAYKAIKEKRLQAIMTDYTIEDSSAYAVYPQTRFVSYRVRKFIDFLTARFAGQPYWDT